MLLVPMLHFIGTRGSTVALFKVLHPLNALLFDDCERDQPEKPILFLFFYKFTIYVFRP